MKATTVKINKTKTWLFEKIHKIGKPLARFDKKKENKSRKQEMKKHVTTDKAEIQRIITYCFEQLCGNKIHNLEEMDKFLEKFNILRLNQEEIEIMNNQFTSMETEL